VLYAVSLLRKLAAVPPAQITDKVTGDSPDSFKPYAFAKSFLRKFTIHYRLQSFVLKSRRPA
jgi:hypothetical protein